MSMGLVCRRLRPRTDRRGWPEFVGGLVVYGVNYPDMYRRAASFAGAATLSEQRAPTRALEVERAGSSPWCFTSVENRSAQALLPPLVGSNEGRRGLAGVD